jgi:hypothetical protein
MWVRVQYVLLLLLLFAIFYCSLSFVICSCSVVGCGGKDWIELAQDRDRWRALLIAVMNLRLP